MTWNDAIRKRLGENDDYVKEAAATIPEHEPK